MRNAAAAHIDDDFDLVETPRKRKPRRAATGKQRAAKRFRFSFDTMKVARYAGIAISVTMALGIVVNALMMQKGRHPAPLFGKSIVVGAPAAPPHVAQPKKAEPAPSSPAAVETPRAPPAPPSKPTTASEDGPTKADPIARLLQERPQDRVHERAPEHAAAPEKVPSKTVFGAQRALVKLGFVLKPNGNLGPQTKKAIEMFEKERHLPVKGELSRRILKVLAAESGLKIEP